MLVQWNRFHSVCKSYIIMTGITFVMLVCIPSMVLSDAFTPTSSGVRLFGSPYSWKGTVEVFNGSVWGTVCDQCWDNTHAQWICELLGFPTADATWTCCSAYGEGTGHGFILNPDETLCLIDPESCTHQTDAGVRCGAMDNCVGHQCSNGARCVDLDNDYECSCMSGYTGTLCETDIDECTSNPCTDGFICHNLLNAYRCTCPPGYTGTSCEIVDTAFDPCETGYHDVLVNQYFRSVAYTMDTPRCDRELVVGWYRVLSPTGNDIATECPGNGTKRCGAEAAIWMQGTIPAEADGISDRTACVGGGNGCCSSEIDIKVKNCGDYRVYYLLPPPTCTQVYCFGTEVQCAAGESSETGFSPGCSSNVPADIPAPVVVPGLGEVGTQLLMIFTCDFRSQVGRWYDVMWYINDQEVTAFTNIEFSVLSSTILHEANWTDKYKLGMTVKCSVRVRFAKDATPSLYKFSEDFYAGLKASQSVYRIREGESRNITIMATVPIGCVYGKDAQHFCNMEIPLAAPSVSHGSSGCQNAIAEGDIAFQTLACGIVIKSTTWNQPFQLHVTGYIDGVYNGRDREINIELQTAESVAAHPVWNNVSAADIKVLVTDADAGTAHVLCYSVNDPHMKIFRQTNGGQWENQRNGEFVMYTHDILPIAVHAMYTGCNRFATCNCGIAIKNSNGLFVANFCGRIGYSSVSDARVNRYIEARYEDRHMVVRNVGRLYTVTLPTGTQITFKVGYVYGWFGILFIQIKPSVMDTDKTKGLCGTFTDSADELRLPGNSGSTTNWNTFAESWRIQPAAENSLFVVNPELDTPASEQVQYCVCGRNTSNRNTLDSNEVHCNLTEPLRLCTTASTGIFGGPGRSGRRKRSLDTGSDDVNDMIPIVYDDDYLNTPEQYDWRDGWNETAARQYCETYMSSSQAYVVCRDTVGVETDSTIQNCVTDIKITADVQWASVAMDAFKTACQTEVSKNATFWESPSTSGEEGKTILDDIMELLCPNDCYAYGHGACGRDGVCSCVEGYAGDDCSLHKSIPPNCERIPFSGLCDTSIGRSCRSTVVYGVNFAPFPDQTCRFRYYEILASEPTFDDTTYTSQAQYISPVAIACTLPRNKRHRRSTGQNSNIPYGYLISLSNDGVTFGQELSFLIYNGDCYQCDSGDQSCTMTDTCPISEDASVDTSGLPTPAVVGAAIGSILLAGCVITVICCLIHKSKKRAGVANTDQTIEFPISRADYCANTRYMQRPQSASECRDRSTTPQSTERLYLQFDDDGVRQTSTDISIVMCK